MPGLITTSSYLYEKRINDVQEILKPLAEGSTVHCAFVPGAIGDGTQVISSINGLAKKPDNYHDWRFPVKAAPNVWFQYFEFWKLLNLGRDCSINRAYLHLYLKNQRSLDPLLCVHSDPLEQPADPEDERLIWQCVFKRGPHVHVSTAGELAHCHFPLNYGHIDDVLSSIEELTKAMADAVLIVRREVVEIFADSSRR